MKSLRLLFIAGLTIAIFLVSTASAMATTRLVATLPGGLKLYECRFLHQPMIKNASGTYTPAKFLPVHTPFYRDAYIYTWLQTPLGWKIVYYNTHIRWWCRAGKVTAIRRYAPYVRNYVPLLWHYLGTDLGPVEIIPSGRPYVNAYHTWYVGRFTYSPVRLATIMMKALTHDYELSGDGHAIGQYW